MLFFAVSLFGLKENPGTLMFLKLDSQKKAFDGSLFFLEYDGKQLIEKDPPGEIKLSDKTLSLFNQHDIPGYRRELTKLVQDELRRIIEVDSQFLISYLGEEEGNEAFLSLEGVPVSEIAKGAEFKSDEYNCTLVAPSEDWGLVTEGLRTGTIAKFSLRDAATNDEISVELSVFDLSQYELATSVYDVAQLEYQKLEKVYDIMAADSQDVRTQNDLDCIIKDLQVLRKGGASGAKEKLLRKAYFYAPGTGLILTYYSDNDELVSKYSEDFKSFVNNFRMNK